MSKMARKRERMWKKGKRTCAYCGKKLTLDIGKDNTLTIDHIMPKSRGGTNGKKNIVAACVKCNNIKGDTLPADIAKRLGLPDWWVWTNPRLSDVGRES